MHSVQAPAAALTGGACGFGNLSAAQWPYGMVAAVSSSSPLLQGTAAHNACGTCVEVVCNDAVRPSFPGNFVALLRCCVEGISLCTVMFLGAARSSASAKILVRLNDSKPLRLLHFHQHTGAALVSLSDLVCVRQACLPNVRSAVVLVTDTCSTCGPTQISLAAPVYYQHMSRNPTAAVHYRAVRSLHLDCTEALPALPKQTQTSLSNVE